MNLSSNELFHFTKFDYLKSIVETKSFIPRFSLEFTRLSDSFQHKATFLPVAMVCFCDIPFQHSEEHRKRYGNHGIVLTENWKMKKKLNPVFYIQSESFLAAVFSNFTSMTPDFYPIIDSQDYGEKIPYMLSRIGNNLTYLTYFVKQFENKLETPVHYNGKLVGVYEKRRFYDEKEWRFIPFEAENNNELFLEFDDYLDTEKLKAANQKLEKYKLTFEIDDIEYLIVNSVAEKNVLEDIIWKKFEKTVEIKVIA
jgi:hypothetical protein